MTTHRQRGHSPHTRAQASRCTFDLMVLPTGCLDGAKTPPRKRGSLWPWSQWVRSAPGSLNCPRQRVKGSLFTNVGSHTHSSRGGGAGGSSCWPDLMVFGTEATGWKKRSPGTKSAPHGSDSRAEFCHISWSPGSAGKGPPTWQRPRQGSSQLRLPVAALLYSSSFSPPYLLTN